jgi:hypothetical protein
MGLMKIFINLLEILESLLLKKIKPIITTSKLN